MVMGGGATYVETIRIVVDQTTLTQGLRTAETNYKNTLNRLKALQNVNLKINATGTAAASLTALQTQARNLARTPTNMRVNVTGNAAAQMRSIASQARSLASHAINIPVHAAGGAASALSGLGGLVTEAATVTELIAATKSTMDFNAALNITRNNSTMTAAETAVLGENVSRLSQAYGLNTTDLMNGARQIQDYTQNAAAMGGILNIASEAAASTGANVADTARILAATMHQYGLDVKDASGHLYTLAEVQDNANKVMGVLHYAAAEGNMTMEQFNATSGKTFAIASSLGVPIEQAAAGLATLTRNGFDAAQASTQLTGLFRGIVKPSVEVTKLLAALSKTTGVDLTGAFSAAGVEALGVPGVMDRVNAAAAKLNLTQAEQTQLWMNLIPNIRGSFAGMLIAGKAADDYTSILADLNDEQKTGTFVAAAWARTQEQPATQMKQLEERIAAVQRTIGAFLVPWVLKAVNAFEQWAPWALAAAAALGVRLLPVLKDVTDWLGLLWGAGMNVIDWIGKFLNWILAGVNWLRQHELAVGLLVIGVSMLATGFAVMGIQAAAAGSAVAFLAARQWLLNAALAANPVVLLTMALVGLVVAFAWVYTHSETFRKNTAWAIDFVGTSFSNLGTLVSTNMETIKNVLLLGLGPIGLLVIGWRLNIGNIQGIMTGFATFVSGIFGIIGTFIATNSDAIRNILLVGLGGPIAWIAAAWTSNFGNMRTVVEGAVSWIGTRLNDFFSWIMDIGVKVGVVSADWRTGWEGMKNTAGDAMSATGDTLNKYGQRFGTEFNTIGSTARGAGQAFSEFGTDASKSLSDISKEVQTSGTDIPDLKTPDLKSFLPGTDEIAATQAKLAALNASASAGGAVSIDDQMKALGLTPPAPGAVAAAWQPVGSSVPQGISIGMDASKEDVARGAKLLADLTTQSATDALGANSPSEVFKKIGMDVDAGLATGIKDGGSQVKGAVGELVTLIRNTMSQSMQDSGGLFGGAGLSPEAAKWAQAQKGPLQDAARAAAAEFHIDPDLFVRQINQESGFNPNAVSSAGARGIGQAMPGTGAGEAANLGVSTAAYWADPTLQLRGAAQLMQHLLTKYGGDYTKALSAYNAGEGRVDAGGPLPAETQAYNRAIMGHAAGGWLSEPILGIGASGQLHSFAETKPEYVGAGPTGPGAGPTMVRPQFSITIPVTAAPGASPEETAAAVAAVLETRVPRMLADFASHFGESLNAMPEDAFK